MPRRADDQASTTSFECGGEPEERQGEGGLVGFDVGESADGFDEQGGADDDGGGADEHEDEVAADAALAVGFLIEFGGLAERWRAAFADPDGGDVRDVGGDEHCAFGPVDLAVPDKHCGGKCWWEGEETVATSRCAEGEGSDDGADGEGDETDGGVGADDVAERDGGYVPNPGSDGGGEFFGFGAGKQEGERKGAHPEAGRRGGEVLSELLCSPDDEPHTGEEKYQLDHLVSLVDVDLVLSYEKRHLSRSYRAGT